MGKTHIKIKKKEILPFMFCILSSAYYTLKGWKYESSLVEVFLIMALICGILNTVKNVSNRKKAIIILTPLVLLIIYRFSIGADTRLFVSLVAILVGMNVDFDKIAKWILYSKAVFLLTAFLIGGYVHLNYMAMNIGVIVFLVLYIYYPQHKVKSFIVAILIYVLGIFLSKSGSMIICVGIGLALYIFMNTKMGKRMLSLKCMVLLFPMVLFLNWLIVGMYATYIFSNPSFSFIKELIPSEWSSTIVIFLNMLDAGLTGRISLSAFSFGRFGFSLWGGNIDYGVDTGLPYFLVDSGMMLLLQDWGLIITAVVMILFVFLMKRLVQNRNYRLIISAIVIALWAFNEDTLLAVGTNYLFYAIGYELSSLRKKIIDGDK